MFQKSKVPANTLILTIVIALILAILCTSLILLAWYNRQHQLTAATEQRLQRNVESAINLVLADGGVSTTPQSDTLDLFDEQLDSVVIKKAMWGIFETGSVRAFNNRFSKQQAFISGALLPTYMDGCIYLADHKRPLSVSGKTNLTGDVYLSKAGIRPTYINQRGFDNSNLVNGNIKISRENLPALNDQIINYLFGSEKALDTFHTIAWPPADSLVQSFYDSIIYVHSKKEVQLDGLTLKGHIVIRSDSIIEAGATTTAEDVILIAPVIKFSKGFKGTLQAIATDSLLVEAGCTFEYPSALILLKKPAMKLQNFLKMGEDCRFNGIIITKCDSADLYKSYVEINRNTRLNGIVYVMGYLTLGATLEGTVLCDYFLYKNSNIVYENTLVDAVINRQGLSRYFIGSPVFDNASRKQIIKWVK